MKNHEAKERYRELVTPIYKDAIEHHEESKLYAAVMQLISEICEPDEKETVTGLDGFKVRVMGTTGDHPLTTQANRIIHYLLEQEDYSYLTILLSSAIKECDELHCIIDLTETDILSGHILTWAIEIKEQVELIQKG